MKFIIVVVVLVICAFLFILILNRGADSRRTNPYARERDDEAQEKALKQMMEKKKQKNEKCLNRTFYKTVIV